MCDGNILTEKRGTVRCCSGRGSRAKGSAVLVRMTVVIRNSSVWSNTTQGYFSPVSLSDVGQATLLVTVLQP